MFFIWKAYVERQCFLMESLCGQAMLFNGKPIRSGSCFWGKPNTQSIGFFGKGHAQMGETHIK